MKVLTKVIGLLFIVFAVTFFQAEPLQKRHHGPHKKHYRGHYKPKYKKVVYYRNGPKHYHKKHYYRHYSLFLDICGGKAAANIQKRAQTCRSIRAKKFSIIQKFSE